MDRRREVKKGVMAESLEELIERGKGPQKEIILNDYCEKNASSF